MDIIEAKDVDLITPFPASEIHRIWGWIQCFRSIILDDTVPKERDKFLDYMAQYIDRTASFGIIDKNGLLGMPHPAPIIGVVTFEPIAPTNGYFHVASTRRAWGSRLVDQAGVRLIDYLFNQYLNLTRVSAYVHCKNRPAQALLKRVGFKMEGVIADLISSGGQPNDALHFGVTRRSWVWDGHKQP